MFLMNLLLVFINIFFLLVLVNFKKYFIVGFLIWGGVDIVRMGVNFVFRCFKFRFFIFMIKLLNFFENYRENVLVLYIY